MFASTQFSLQTHFFVTISLNNNNSTTVRVPFMSIKKISLSIALLGCITSSSIYPSLYDDGAQGIDRLKNMTALEGTAIGSGLFLVASVFILFNREPAVDAKPRYDLSKVINASLLVKQPGAYLTNIKYVYLDGFVGQYFKDKFMKWKKDGNY